MNINLLSNNDFEKFLFFVMCETIPVEKFHEYCKERETGSLDLSIEMEVKVNGITVPDFKEKFIECLKYSENDFRKSVGQEVEKLMSFEKIKKMFHTIDEFQYELKQKFQEIVGEKIEWPSDEY